MGNRQKDARFIALSMVLIFLMSCATTPLGRAVQTAHVQKQLVEISAVEFAKLHVQGTVPDDAYVKGKTAYEKWAKGEVALAKSLSDWKRLEDLPSSQRLSDALRLSGELFRAYVDAIGQWVDLEKIRQKIGG